MQLSIIILSYNKKNLLRSCLKSILSTIHSVDYEVIVFDNASNDGSPSMVKDEFPRVHILESSENIGFGNGNNEAVSFAKGEYLLFLNSDTEFLDENFAEMIQFYNRHRRVGILGGMLVNEDGTPQLSYNSFYSVAKVFRLLFLGERFGISTDKTIKKVDWVTGASMFISKQLFEEIGGFDKKIFMYIEDMEICWRVTERRYGVYYYPALKLRHVGQGSSNRSFAIIQTYKNLLYFYRKHKSILEYAIVKMLLLIKAYMVIVLGILTMNRTLVKRYKEAIKFQ